MSTKRMKRWTKSCRAMNSWVRTSHGVGRSWIVKCSRNGQAAAGGRQVGQRRGGGRAGDESFRRRFRSKAPIAREGRSSAARQSRAASCRPARRPLRRSPDRFGELVPKVDAPGLRDEPPDGSLVRGRLRSDNVLRRRRSPASPARPGPPGGGPPWTARRGLRTGRGCRHPPTRAAGPGSGKSRYQG